MLDRILTALASAIARYFELCSADFTAEGQEPPGAGYNAPFPESLIEIPILHRGGALRGAC